MTTFKIEKNIWPFDPTPGFEVVCKDSLFAFNSDLCSIPFNLICNMTTFRKGKKLTFWPHPRGRGCVHICFHGDLCSIPFNLICNMTTFRKKNDLTFWPHPRGPGCVCGPNICYHVAASILNFNLICNMTIFWKSLILASAPPLKCTPGDRTQAFKLKTSLICFISIAAWPTCKISVKNIDNRLSYCKIQILDPLGGVKGVG